ncbi:MAG: hypothetical protein KC427_04510 [Sulfurovum sp.]|uniref:hypothetical protein n=1 Tax=Sulfurovum sp. TaxID=1969726 RepID=UPI002868056D|nr:hypothetical protein [Sulfurovum sp.]MCO4845262.1 hypothetical protein [Sulfurovum sp.]
MYTIEMEKECSCFKKSGHDSTMTFETREDMINKARVLECLMNQQFCMKHFFEAVDYGEKIIIHSSERPADEDEDDHIEDASTLVNKSGVTIGFDASKSTPSGDGGN